MCAALDAQPGAARTNAFGITATQTCLKHRGATFGSASDPAIAALPAKQRVKVLAGVLPPGTALLYLVIGSDGADAVSLRNQLAKQVEFRPTPANSRVGQKGNAAWFIESIAGQRPPPGLTSTVINCLRTGPATTPMPITFSTLSDCVGVHSGQVLGPRERRLLFPPIPSVVSTHMIAALIPGNPADASQGIFAFALIGRNAHDSLMLRNRLMTALAGHLAGAETGQARGPAWLTIPTKRASGAQVRQARRIFSDCVA